MDYSAQYLARLRSTASAAPASDAARAAMLEDMQQSWVEMSACYRSVRLAGEPVPDAERLKALFNAYDAFLEAAAKLQPGSVLYQSPSGQQVRKGPQ